MKVAVMGCIVNGPGESKHADIGISLPGTGEAPAAPVFIDGEKALTLRGEASPPSSRPSSSSTSSAVTAVRPTRIDADAILSTLRRVTAPLTCSRQMPPGAASASFHDLT
jgi:hypothetical protein